MLLVLEIRLSAHRIDVAIRANPLGKSILKVLGHFNSKTTLHPYFTWAFVCGNTCRFPSNGRVGGPGGKPGSRDPILRTRLTIQDIARANTVQARSDIVAIMIGDPQRSSNERLYIPS